MPEFEPPTHCPGIPQLSVIEPGTELWRIHSTERTAATMNPAAQSSAHRGGRFDSLDGSYAYLYVGDSPEAAVAETICRDLPLPGPAARIVSTARLAGRALSRLTTNAPIRVVKAHGGPALSQLGQDSWLTKSEPTKYLLTRRWAAAIADWAPDAAGLEYRCRNDEDSLAWMLATDPDTLEHPGLTPKGAPLALEAPEGRTLIRWVLTGYNATLA